MRLVVQRVLESSVKVDGREVGRVGKGFMVLCGVEDGDTQDDVRYCVDKTVNLRIFEDDEGKMNRCLRCTEMFATGVARASSVRRVRSLRCRCMRPIVRVCAMPVCMLRQAFFRRI